MKIYIFIVLSIIRKYSMLTKLTLSGKNINICYEINKLPIIEIFDFVCHILLPIFYISNEIMLKVRIQHFYLFL